MRACVYNWRERYSDRHVFLSCCHSFAHNVAPSMCLLMACLIHASVCELQVAITPRLLVQHKVLIV